MMKNNRDNQIGYNRQVKLEWLDFTASLIAMRETPQNISSSLDNYLKDQLSIGSNAVRGSRGKTISILLSIWVTVPQHLVELRDEAISLMKRLSTSEHLALHWGMTMTAYPFFGVVAETAGRMLSLQGTVSSLLLQSRMREIYGQRETAIRSTRYALYSFSEWGVLAEASERGVYRLPEKKDLKDRQLQEWLIKSLLISEGKKLAPVNTIIRSPKLFPFRFEEPFKPEDNSRLEFFRQGLDEEMALLK
jgi:hypothetical protein